MTARDTGTPYERWPKHVLIAALREADEREQRLREAATPLARLPFPVSSDERDDWRVYQQALKAALATTPDLGGAK